MARFRAPRLFSSRPYHRQDALLVLSLSLSTTPSHCHGRRHLLPPDTVFIRTHVLYPLSLSALTSLQTMGVKHPNMFHPVPFLLSSSYNILWSYPLAFYFFPFFSMYYVQGRHSVLIRVVILFSVVIHYDCLVL